MSRVLGVAAAALFSSAAFGADLPQIETPEPAATPVAYDWNGFYVGAFGGFGWGDIDVDFDNALFSGSATYSADGALAGGQVGGDWQWRWAVLGVRADAFWVDFNGNDGGEDGVVDTFDADFIASLTGRVGAAFDRFHVYALGGGAVLDYDYSLEVPGIGSETHDDDAFGVTLGAGAEVLITNHIAAFGEYRHYWFNGDDIDFAGVPGGFVAQTISADVDFDTIHAGLSWRF
jgi:outer membrane immunogenic protein